jgi:hypothetical protein
VDQSLFPYKYINIHLKYLSTLLVHCLTTSSLLTKAFDYDKLVMLKEIGKE